MILPNQRIVTTEVYEMPGAEAAPEAEAPLNVVTFREASGRTTVTILVSCPNEELRDLILNSGMETGMQEQMDALEQLDITLRRASPTPP
jgi:uncharacterized protein YndB with AHSA1/START domain